MYFLFLALWIIFNGTFTWEIFWIGAVISAALYWFVCRFMDYSLKKDLAGLGKLGKVLIYVVTLVVEIVKANKQVIHYILTSKYEIEPTLVKFRTNLKKDSSRAVLANSITLTPGTITVSLTGNEYVVHCLDKELAEGMDDSVFVQQLRRMEKNK
ncbi:MAG: Na+/H+ antiporter subunit E [Lachnospiraceae bacterium]|nr:Na+/H+ antiporter subunit E [Lachnospiraceae bacterium]MBP3609351.1 Na+/H+ antiporter subunit E [Lachnospiraceae bacterium]